MPKSTGWTWEKWETCALCGRQYRTSLMTTQRSLRVCTVRPCHDISDPAVAASDGVKAIEFSEHLEVADERR